LENLIEFEEYETCALAIKLKDKLNKGNASVTKKTRVGI
jgi:hypothetical protein